MPARPSSRWPLVSLALAFPFLALAPSTGRSQEPGQGQGADFREARRGDVPESVAGQITPETDRAIQVALDWLGRQGNSDGSFGRGDVPIAVTSLGGLALMSSGSTPGRGPHGPRIDQALQYILDNTGPSGFINVAGAGSQGPMYGHGFATLFLAEAYGMTRRPEIRDKLEKAVRLIIDTQNQEGGWRYQPVRRDADLSVTICQINALRAARNAGLFVPRETVDACIKYVKLSQNPDGGFRYQVRGGPSAFPRSAAGVVALFSAGEYETKEVDNGIAYLHQSAPGRRFPSRDRYFFYGHYYAIQAMWVRGGDDWDRWFPAIRDDLLARQNADGSWSDDYGSEFGTAMALIILQVPNSYLPIFQR